MIGDLPYGGLADRAGYCNNLEGALSAVSSGKIAKGFYCVIDHEYGSIRKSTVFDFPANYSTDSTFGESIRHVVVTVEIIAGDSKETVAGFNSSRISTYAGEIIVTRDSVLVARISLGCAFIIRARFLIENFFIFFLLNIRGRLSCR